MSGPVHLVFKKRVEPVPGYELVPYYHFKIIIKDGIVAGHINFKTGDTRHIRLCAGHIGYEILPEHRGNCYAYYACDALKPFAGTFYDSVIITADPDNIASLKIIEKLNTTYLNEIQVPEDDPSYKGEPSSIGGARIKKRYQWDL